MEETRYYAGEVVRVVKYNRCPYVWIPAMDEFVGKEVTIYDASKITKDGKRIDRYYIEEDHQRFTWCADCFEPIEEDLLFVDIEQLNISSLL